MSFKKFLENTRLNESRIEGDEYIEQADELSDVIELLEDAIAHATRWIEMEIDQAEEDDDKKQQKKAEKAMKAVDKASDALDKAQ